MNILHDLKSRAAHIGDAGRSAENFGRRHIQQAMNPGKQLLGQALGQAKGVAIGLLENAPAEIVTLAESGVSKAAHGLSGTTAAKYMRDNKDGLIDEALLRPCGLWLGPKRSEQFFEAAGEKVADPMSRLYHNDVFQAAGSALNQSAGLFSDLSTLPDPVGPMFSAANIATEAWYGAFLATGTFDGSVSASDALAPARKATEGLAQMGVGANFDKVSGKTNEISGKDKGHKPIEVMQSFNQIRSGGVKKYVVGVAQGTLKKHLGQLTGIGLHFKRIAKRHEVVTGVLDFLKLSNDVYDKYDKLGGTKVGHSSLERGREAVHHLHSRGLHRSASPGSARDGGAQEEQASAVAAGVLSGIGDKAQAALRWMLPHFGGDGASPLLSSPMPGGKAGQAGTVADGGMTGPYYPAHWTKRHYPSAEAALNDSAHVAVYVNGVQTPLERHVLAARALARQIGKPVVGIYNASGNAAQDFGQSATDKFGILGMGKRNAAVNTLARVVGQHGSPKAKNGGLDLYAHSQGSIIVSEAIRQAKGEGHDVRGLDVTTFGNAAWSRPSGLRGYHNYAYDSDVIPTMLGSTSLIGAALRTRFNQSNPLNPFMGGQGMTSTADDTFTLHHRGAGGRPHGVIPDPLLDAAGKPVLDKQGKPAPDAEEYYIGSLRQFRAKERTVRARLNSLGPVGGPLASEALTNAMVARSLGATGFAFAKSIGAGVAGLAEQGYGAASGLVGRGYAGAAGLVQTGYGKADRLVRQGYAGTAQTVAGAYSQGTGGAASGYGRFDGWMRRLPSLPWMRPNTVWGALDRTVRGGASGLDHGLRGGGAGLDHGLQGLGRAADMRWRSNAAAYDLAARSGGGLLDRGLRRMGSGMAGAGRLGANAVDDYFDATNALQRSGHGDHPDVDPAALRADLRRQSSGFLPDSGIRAKLGGPLGFDPGGARLHTGPAAASASRRLNAEAFTIGNDVFFGEGRFDPHSPKGLGLIAHELTHVGQQTGTTGSKARFFTAQGGDEMEREAQGVGAHVLANAGHRSGLFVEDYIQEYEGEQALTQADQQRLDRISVKALDEARGMLERQNIHGLHANAFDVQVEIDLSEMSDGEAARVWAEAIVGGLQADRDLLHAPRVALQRSDLSGPQQETNEHKHLRLRFNSIEDDAKSMRNIHKDYVQSNNWNVFRWTSDRLGNGSAPPVGIWDRPGHYIQQGRTYLEQGNLGYAAETLRDAEEVLNQAKQKWHFYLDGAIAGAEKGIKGAEVIRDTSIALEAGLAGAAVAPLVFAGAAGVATTAGVTGVSATILSGVAAVGVSAVTGGVVQGGIEKAYFGDKRGGFSAGFKRGAVSGAMGGGGALAAPGISAAISSRAFGTTPELLTTFGQRAAVNALTGAAIGAPLNGVNSAIVNLPALSNGMISSGEYLKRIGWDSLYGAMIGGGLGILGSIGRSKNTGLVKNRLPDARANWEPGDPLVDAKTGEIEVTSRNTQTGQVLRMKFNPNTGEGVITDLVTGDTMVVRIDPTQTNPAPHAADAVPQLEGPRIKIPQYLEADRGSAVQEWSPEAVTAKASVEQGATLYRIGAMGRSEAAEGQYWSLEKPTAANFLAKFGIPNSNAAVPDFYETAIIKPGAEFITRVAPGVGSNPGGSIEVVVDPGEVKMTGWHAMNIMEDGRIIPLTSDRLALPSGMLKATPMLPPGRPPLSDPMLTQRPGKNIATWENDPTAKVDFDVHGDAVTVYGLYRGNQPQGSGGEMLATSLKRAGASRPRVIVLDDVVNEPTKQDLLNGKDFLVTKLGRTLQDTVSRMGGRISETKQYRERTGSRRKPEIKIDVTVHIEYDAEK